MSNSPTDLAATVRNGLYSSPGGGRNETREYAAAALADPDSEGDDRG